MHHPAMLVREDLKLYVMRIDNEFFNVDIRVAESLVRLQARGVIALYQASFMAGDAHSAAPSARHCLDHHRKADLSGDSYRFFLTLHRPIASRRNRNPRPASALASGIFVSHQPDGARWRSDKLDIAAGANLGEVAVFGEEAVAGVNRVHVGDLRSADDPIDFEVAFGTGRRPDANGFIRQLDVETFQVGLGIDGDGLNPEFFARSDDPEGDFAPIRDEDFLEHYLTIDRIFGRLRAPVPLFDPKENLPKLDRLSVFRTYLRNDAGNLGFDLIHHLHRFNDADDRFRGNLLTDGDVGSRLGRRSRVEGADHGRFDLLVQRGFCSGFARGVGLSRGGCGRDRRRHGQDVRGAVGARGLHRNLEAFAFHF